MTTIGAVAVGPATDHAPPLTRVQRRLAHGVLHGDLSELEQALTALGELARSVDDPRLAMLTDVADQRLDNLRGTAAELGVSVALPEDVQTTDLGRCLVRSMQRVRAALNVEVGRVQVADTTLLVAARPALLELACEQLLLAAAVPGDAHAVRVSVTAEADGVLLTTHTSAQLGTDTLMRVLPQISHALEGDAEGRLMMTRDTVSFRCDLARAVVDATGTTLTVMTASTRTSGLDSTADAVESVAGSERVG
jgi:hypothetical protein